jgi:hypothetical protein
LPVKAESSIANVVRHPSAALSSLNAGTGGTEVAEIAINGLIIHLLDYFNVAWNNVQVDECAQLFAVEYGWMTAAEIKHFFTKCKIGEYTKDDFRKLSPFQFMGWLSDYAGEVFIERGRYGVEREREERKAKQAERENNPEYMAFDLSKALAAIGRPVPKSDEEIAEEDEAFRRRRDAQVKSFITEQGLDISKIAGAKPMPTAQEVAIAIAAGDPLAKTPEFLQVHANNAGEVERYLKLLNPAA